MSLATRLSAFFLIALAVVLAGFSGTLYLLARNYLVRELDERLQSATGHAGSLGRYRAGRPGMGAGRPPDDSGSGPGADRRCAGRFATAAARWSTIRQTRLPRSISFSLATRVWPSHPIDATAFGVVPGWRLAGRRLRLDDLLRQGRGHPDDEPGYEVQYPGLDLVVGLEPAPVEATLSWLGLTLAGLSTGRLADGRGDGPMALRCEPLAPVNRMARAATAMTAADLGNGCRCPARATNSTISAEPSTTCWTGSTTSFVRLNEAYDRQRRFAGDASHQLRTPVAALLGQAQVALRRDRSTDEYKRFLERVQSEGDTSATDHRIAAPAGPARRLPSPSPSVIDLRNWVPDHLARWRSHRRALDLRAEIRDDLSCVCEQSYAPRPARG